MADQSQSPLYKCRFFDVSQFVAEPLRTGVQRILVKTLEHLPREDMMPFIVLDEDRVGILDNCLFDIIIRFFYGETRTARGKMAEVHELEHKGSDEEMLIKLIGRRPIAIAAADRFFARAGAIINLESFSWPQRSRFYISCPEEHRGKVSHFIHDFLIFENPAVFPQLNWRYASDYVLLFDAYRLSGRYLVSTPEMVQRVAQYFMKGADTVHLVRIGGDTFRRTSAVEMAPPDARRRVVMLGTLEPRKYPLEVTKALADVAERHADIDCSVVGSWGWIDASTRAQLEEIFGRGAVKHLPGQADDQVTTLMQQADVGIYVSSAEGFGLPVIEFGNLGTKLITNRAVPAASLVESAHATILNEVSRQSIGDAIEDHLARPAQGRLQYYPWTWSDTCADILDATRIAMPEDARKAAACWMGAVRLAGSMRGAPTDWEGLKREVAREITHADDLGYEMLSGRTADFAGQDDALLESVAEIISDNRHLIYWADFIQCKTLVMECLRSLAADNHLDALGRAFLSFLGRPIDGRAASEAVGLNDPVQVFRRIMDLIQSREAEEFMGARALRPFLLVMRAVEPAILCVLGRHVDTVRLNEKLGLGAPTLADVMRAENLRAAGVDRWEVLVFLAHGRRLTGDVLDIFLDCAACWCVDQLPSEERKQPSLNRSLGLGGADEAPKKTSIAIASSSFHHPVSLASPLFFDGWHSVEYSGSNMFRWMDATASLRNPEPERPILEVKIDVQHVYGGEEPLVLAYFGGKIVQVSLEEKTDGPGWIVSIRDGQTATKAPFVRIESLYSGCPASAEGTVDTRVLSLCVLSVLFIYRD